MIKKFQCLTKINFYKIYCEHVLFQNKSLSIFKDTIIIIIVIMQ